ncbi:MAG: glycosyl hydrolase family 95 catalytic domain-containing protein [Sedimentisphaeraceae bacterium JB056]
MKNLSKCLWYDSPAKNFNEALPLGNGRLGAMVYGGAGREKIALNHDSIWAGRDAVQPLPQAKKVLPEVRRLLFEEKYREAQRLIEENMLTDFNQPYLPAGDLLIDTDGIYDITGYKRSLDLTTAVSTVAITDADNRSLTRECFCSYVDDVFAMRIHSDSEIDKLMFSLDSQMRHKVHCVDGGLMLKADIPISVIWKEIDDTAAPEDIVKYDSSDCRSYAISMRVLTEKGEVVCDDKHLQVCKTDEITIFLAVSVGEDKDAVCTQASSKLDRALSKGFSRLRDDHINDYQRLFKRVTLELGSVEKELSRLATDERIKKHAVNNDTQLEALLFDYGRYLLIASSREGCEAANLQGIWNESMQPPWWSNYTLNINTQMNYWPAEVCNLSECHEPLFELVRQLSGSGRKTAEIHYGCKGWTAHHQTDFLRQTTPVGKLKGRVNYGAAQYAMWPMGGAWLCTHLWEHFLYTQDIAFLEKHWPVIKDAAVFLLDWLVLSPDGRLVTAPSTSPENMYKHPGGYLNSVCISSAMDISIVNELFDICVKASDILELDDIIISEIKEAVKLLPEIKITDSGEIIEWNENWEQGEANHRHLSHLIGLYPFAQITKDVSPQLARAARRSLEQRGDKGTGWSLAWKVSLWARLKNGNRCHKLIGDLFSAVQPNTDLDYHSGGGLYPNMLAAHPPFQIDANFGFTAAVAEMLVQSHNGKICLLPALPDKWKTGKVCGLRARGGITVNIEWKDNKLAEAKLYGSFESDVVVRYCDKELDIKLGSNKTVLITGCDF